MILLLLLLALLNPYPGCYLISSDVWSCRDSEGRRYLCVLEENVVRCGDVRR